MADRRLDSVRREVSNRTRRLLRPGAIEKLVAQGRKPRIFGDPPFICMIPPEGIQQGDSVAMVHPGEDITLEYFGSDGMSRGREVSVVITPRQAERIQERIQRALAVNTQA